MRTTLNLSEDLLEKVMKIMKTKSKSETIKKALEHYYNLHESKKIINFRGKVDLDIDLDILRDRKRYL